MLRLPLQGTLGKSAGGLEGLPSSCWCCGDDGDATYRRQGRHRTLRAARCPPDLCPTISEGSFAEGESCVLCADPTAHICRTTTGLAPDVGVWLWVALVVSALACASEALLSRHLCLQGRRAVEGLSQPLLSSQTDTEPPKKDFHATISGLLRLSSACSLRFRHHNFLLF